MTSDDGLPVRGPIGSAMRAWLDDTTATAYEAALVRIRPFVNDWGLGDWKIITRRLDDRSLSVEFIEPGRNRSVTFGMALPERDETPKALESYFTELLERMAEHVGIRLSKEPDAARDSHRRLD